MTSAQLEPSAHAPCTSTTLRASAGLADCADGSAARSVAKSKQTATMEPPSATPKLTRGAAPGKQAPRGEIGQGSVYPRWPRARCFLLVPARFGPFVVRGWVVALALPAFP